MNFNIVFSKQATKAIRLLEKNTKERVLERFKLVSTNPFLYLEHFEGDYYKLRIGDYRTLIDMDFSTSTLIVRVFDKRGRIYKRANRS